MGGFNPISAAGGFLGGIPGAIGGSLISGNGPNPLSGKGGDSGPSAPDFMKAAMAQTTNPFGVSSKWSRGPDGGYQQNTSFSGPLGDAAKSMEGQAASSWGTPLDNGAQARQHAEDAIYGRSTSRLDPRFAQEQHDLTTQLANQGIDPNSQAYATALGNFGRTKNDAYSTAMQDAITGGGAEAQRQQGMDLTSRFAPLQGLQGMAGLTGQAQNPLLPAAIAQYQGLLQKYGIDQQGKNSTMGGLMGLGGTIGAAGIAASDERVKYEIERHPTREVLPGVPEATFKYLDDPDGTRYVGVIAQDVERAGYGHLVTEIDGVKMVDPSLAPIPVEEDDR